MLPPRPLREQAQSSGQTRVSQLCERKLLHSPSIRAGMVLRTRKGLLRCAAPIGRAHGGGIGHVRRDTWRKRGGRRGRRLGLGWRGGALEKQRSELGQAGHVGCRLVVVVQLQYHTPNVKKRPSPRPTLWRQYKNVPARGWRHAPGAT